ncbi:peroxiredoxin family protein [Patiriisocius marinus]|uniref:peroxiredoxin family protein n=1 Tax=Patiriisocius marinus TaxID=1397112 RepID=UPI00232DAB48|nr:TlpA disulfide reductase family protein [Patiriisocius marinus]
MKNLILTLLFGLFISSQVIAQEPPQSIQINDQTIIRDPQGNDVDLTDFMTMMDSKEWSLEPKTNADGTNYIQLIKLSEEEQKLMVQSRMPKENDFNGHTLPYFNMIDRNGNIIKTDNTEGKVVVFNFWFATCPPCIKEIPELNEVYEKYKNNDNIVFAAVTFEKEEKIARFQTKHNLKYPIVGKEGSFSQAVTRGAYPTNVIVKRDGTIQEYISGGMVGIGKQIEAAIEAALE